MKKSQFIEISGADGSGKTTLANSLVINFRSRGYKSKYVWIRSRHTLAYVLSRVLMSLGWKKTFINPNGMKITRFQLRDSVFTRKLWPLIEFLSVLPLIIFKVLLPMRLGYVIVSDRYTIDTIVSIILNTRNVKFINSILGKLLVRLIPKKNTIILLNVDYLTVKNRRYDIEYTEEEIKLMIKSYKVISKLIHMHSIDSSTRSISTVKNIVNNLLFKEVEKELPFISDELLHYSIVIPTVNRDIKLKKLLYSILKQEKTPLEIILVDQSDNLKTFDLFNEMHKILAEKKIDLKYYYMKNKNAAKARNIGIENSKGEIVFLVDDDVIMLKDYSRNLLKIYYKYPDAVGVQGFISSPKGLEKMKTALGRIENNLRRIFYLTNFQKDIWKIMPSLNDIFPFPFTTTITTQRLQGCCSFKRDILEKFKYDENLDGWSFLEDLDLSYRIYKSKSGTLYATPRAKLIHKEHLHTASLKDASYKKIVNRLYMFNKLIEKKPQNYLIFMWSLFGLFLTTIIGQIIHGKKGSINISEYSEHNRLISTYYLKAMFLAFKHRKEIKNYNLNFLKNYI